MDLSMLAATAITCVAMFQAPITGSNDAIFISNGTATTRLFDSEDRSGGNDGSWYFTSTGTAGSVLFSGYSSAKGRELWTANGVAGGTKLLKDIYVGSQFWSNPGGPANKFSVPNGGTAFTTRFQKVGTRIVFAADSASHGRELWASDGTLAGTVLVKDHIPNGQSGIGDATDEFLFSNGLYAIYVANDILFGKSLWATNGTPAGTRHLAGYTEYPIPKPFGLLGTSILFGRNNASELWITNGSAAGTKKIKTFAPQAIQNISSVKGTTYALMSVYTAAHGQELWVTDGTAAGTKLLRNINLNNAGSNPGTYASGSEHSRHGAYFKIGNKVVFPATDDPTGRELWVTQGTAATTLRLANLTPGVEGSDFHQFAVQGNNLYFAAAVTEDGKRVVRPFVTNGISAGTKKLSTTLNVNGRMVALRNGVLFPGATTDGDQYLWRTGATPNNQVRVSNIIPGSVVHLQSVQVPSTDGINRPCP